MTKVIGYSKRNEGSGKWDSTLIWSTGCLENWGHQTRRNSRVAAMDNARRLGMTAVKWRKI